MVHEVHVLLKEPAAASAESGANENVVMAPTSVDVTMQDGEMKPASDGAKTSHVSSKSAAETDSKQPALKPSRKTKSTKDPDDATTNEQPSPRILPGPTVDGDSIDFPLSAIADHLICPLCQGYFRDPYTVADCLHSFCRSCLILHFRVGHRRCPTW